ncbi:inositol polyphosphate-5-phosphatase A isoform X3 [Tribolium castaneum]|uniref:inositol polyphosphate-5-phosphatase A isoform X3 n=1 Tax=Tribolium castaneum TaxID=7070 RepID=UPI00046C3722|nr:PREDICTED: type I inositol 1,4,5-trisphosphate 5-phosphatase isoform X3 [Tribolium castaneum]XP_015839278.1 PREDICTED: type I inositol 1,4,5-trisphosphate 5-phosphatase isoform X3 [Tribolium castaneum]XP_015839280.1 PREDICTED: type I inositol 1,4,5-trisphosphate 5-phosphatase isoform X3 [Tribolium castaneum]|eukprot:XP_008198050.1 PREDICTED: type I inositol 1,4,5-trisphosphate 5-phosphatase isoform X3 [Tribolium castaneum]
MGSPSIPALLVTANVGSIFEDPSEMLKIWTEEFLSTVTKLDPKFIALHCQEVGGKNYENSMKHVEHFVKLLMSSNELRLFDKIRIFLDEDYSSAENFTALGNLYFIHESVENVLIWDFNDVKFVPVSDKLVHSGNIEAIATKEKAKFPQDFFPECKWSRKGFLRTRWSLNGTVLDLVNIHLFHDASNFIAMESYPSVYCKNRRRALEHTLQRFHNDRYGKAPYFVFGDFNFRTDTEGVIKKLTEGLTTTRLQNNKNNDYTKLQFANEDSQLVLTVGKKEFNHLDHQKVFLTPSPTWLKTFDKELEAFEKYLTEYPITFPPSYPFEENVSHARSYMQTRCPAWCDRVLLSHTAKQLVDEDEKVEYGLMGLDTCMGDHKPVFLDLHILVNE